MASLRRIVSVAQVTPHEAEIVERARRLADEVLLPSALVTDRADLVAVELLDALADAGLYGLVIPPALGGLGADPGVMWAVMEQLASGCLTTTFVVLQHLAVTGVIGGGDVRPEVRSAWLPAMARAEVRAGVAFAHLRRPGPPVVTIEPIEQGWCLSGAAPWVTGWGRVDVVLVGARHADEVVWSLVDAAPARTLDALPLALAAVNASGTVVLRLRDHPVPAERVVRREPVADWMARDAISLRSNASLALGVSRRAVDLHGDTDAGHALGAELDALRHALDTRPSEELADLRAEATVLALRTATSLMAATGGRAVVRDHHAQRLAREALFLLVQGQTPAIRVGQLSRLA